jgi:hypothetical protein
LTYRRPWKNSVHGCASVFQVCAEIWRHVVDAEQAIQRIEQQLRAAAAVAGNVDSTPRILSEQQKANAKVRLRR